MPTASINEIEIYYEETGQGYPLVWSHEFGGDYRSWEAQVRFFGRRYRNITYNQRGYPPSSVPTDRAAYSNDLLIEDLYQLLRHLGLEQAHLVGLSMGGNVVLNLALRHPEICRSVVIAGTGSGTIRREEFERDADVLIERLNREGMAGAVEFFKDAPTRVQLRRKDPRGWHEFNQYLLEHSAQGSAFLYREVVVGRPTIFSLKEQLNQLRVPALIMIGDEDEPCIEPGVFMKREIPSAGLVVFPESGHCINLEEPALFNQAILDFLTAVEAGKWHIREPAPVAAKT